MPLVGSVAFSGKAKATRPSQAGTPSIVSQASGQIEISWTAPSFSGGAPITDYKIEYSTNGGSTWIEWSHSPSISTSATVTGLADYLTYIFRISAINAVGQGNASNNSSGAAQLNVVTGGTESTISNYNGTGQTWKVHQLTSTGNITISNNIHSFRVFSFGNGGGGGFDVYAGGGGGGMVWNDSATLSNGTYSFTSGSPSTVSLSGSTIISLNTGGSVARNSGNSPGGTVVTVPSGWSSSTGGQGGYTQSGYAANGSGGRTSNITGTSLGYGGGGGGGAWSWGGEAVGVNGGGNGGRDTGNPNTDPGNPGTRGGGGGGAPVYGSGGAGGHAGFYIAYRIS